jgi:hypothetical protein
MQHGMPPNDCNTGKKVFRGLSAFLASMPRGERPGKYRSTELMSKGRLPRNAPPELCNSPSYYIYMGLTRRFALIGQEKTQKSEEK